MATSAKTNTPYKVKPSIPPHRHAWWGSNRQTTAEVTALCCHTMQCWSLAMEAHFTHTYSTNTPLLGYTQVLGDSHINSEQVHTLVLWKAFIVELDRYVVAALWRDQVWPVLSLEKLREGERGGEREGGREKEGERERGCDTRSLKDHSILTPSAPCSFKSS